MENRRVVVYEGDKIIYEGPENRHAHNAAVVEPLKILGFSSEMWVKILGFIIAFSLFYYRTEEFMKSQRQINDYIVKFAKNSDGYHSAITGREFEQGRPLAAQQNQTRVQKFNLITPAQAADNQGE